MVSAGWLAGAGRRDGPVALLGCLDGPVLGAAWCDFAAVYPSAWSIPLPPARVRNRVDADDQPGAIIALPFPRPRCGA